MKFEQIVNGIFFEIGIVTGTTFYRNDEGKYYYKNFSDIRVLGPLEKVQIKPFYSQDVNSFVIKEGYSLNIFNFNWNDYPKLNRDKYTGINEPITDVSYRTPYETRKLLFNKAEERVYESVIIISERPELIPFAGFESGKNNMSEAKLVEKVLTSHKEKNENESERKSKRPDKLFEFESFNKLKNIDDDIENTIKIEKLEEQNKEKINNEKKRKIEITQLEKQFRSKEVQYESQIKELKRKIDYMEPDARAWKDHKYRKMRRQSPGLGLSLLYFFGFMIGLAFLSALFQG